jgi:hypothetical protein
LPPVPVGSGAGPGPGDGARRGVRSRRRSRRG